MHNDDEQTRRTLAEIGVRFLTRTIGEVATLRDLANQLGKAAQVDAHGILKQLEMISHRIRGSGAVFGLEAISQAAEVIELLALQNLNQSQVNVAQLALQLTQAVTKLADECTKKSDGSLP